MFEAPIPDQRSSDRMIPITAALLRAVRALKDFCGHVWVISNQISDVSLPGLQAMHYPSEILQNHYRFEVFNCLNLPKWLI